MTGISNKKSWRMEIFSHNENYNRKCHVFKLKQHPLIPFESGVMYTVLCTYLRIHCENERNAFWYMKRMSLNLSFFGSAVERERTLLGTNHRNHSFWISLKSNAIAEIRCLYRQKGTNNWLLYTKVVLVFEMRACAWIWMYYGVFCIDNVNWITWDGWTRPKKKRRTTI